MTKKFKPLLAASVEDTSSVPYPVMASLKLDGIRVLVMDGVVMSRSLKPIRNKYVQSLFGKAEYEGYDGELIVGDPNAPDVYRVTNSGVMAEQGEPDVRLFVFDRWDMPERPFVERYSTLRSSDKVKVVEQVPISSERELLIMEQQALEDGYEGLMLRNNSGYKYGRSTLKEFTLAKLKRFSDDEFLVVGFQERMHNANEATVNALGHTERSSHKENMVGRGDLGALVLETGDGQVFTAGSGFDDATRKEIWVNRDKYLGRMVKIKHFPQGVKNLPRFPIFLSFRDELDM